MSHFSDLYEKSATAVAGDPVLSPKEVREAYADAWHEAEHRASEGATAESILNAGAILLDRHPDDEGWKPRLRAGKRWDKVRELWASDFVQGQRRVLAKKADQIATVWPRIDYQPKRDPFGGPTGPVSELLGPDPNSGRMTLIYVPTPVARIAWGALLDLAGAQGIQ